MGDRFGGQRQPVELGLQQQGAQVLQTALHLRQLLAVQTVANSQVVVQKAQGRTHGEGVQPQRGFGQFHGHRVLVHAEDAFFEDHAANDVPVVQLRVGHGPAVVVCRGLDGAANMRHAREHRTFPRAAALHQVRGPGLQVDPMRDGGDGLQHAVGQVVHQRHQKMAAAHGGVADFEFQNLAGGVFDVQGVPVTGIKRTFFA